jgi:hypothetical protein
MAAASPATPEAESNAVAHAKPVTKQQRYKILRRCCLMHALYPLYGREVIPLVRELLKEEAGAVPEILTWRLR